MASLRAVYQGLFMWDQSTTPIIIRVPEAPSQQTSVADVLLQAIGLTGAFALAALLAGIVIGGVLFRFRKKRLGPSRPNMQSLGL